MDVATALEATAAAPLERAREVAMLLFELHREPGGPSGLAPEVAERVLNRCVISALEILAEYGAEVIVAGTPARPVVEARFEGTGAVELAARGAEAVLAGVRRVQRARENEFSVVGAITAGLAGFDQEGVPVTVGEADVMLQRLREAAAPGQVLMSAAAREACGGAVDTVPIGVSPDGSDKAYLLHGLSPRAAAVEQG